jgi:hypothetical protein
LFLGKANPIAFFTIQRTFFDGHDAAEHAATRVRIAWKARGRLLRYQQSPSHLSRNEKRASAG